MFGRVVCVDLGGNDVEGPLIVNINVYIGNSQVRIPKVPARDPKKVPIGYQDTALAVSID